MTWFASLTVSFHDNKNFESYHYIVKMKLFALLVCTLPLPSAAFAPLVIGKINRIQLQESAIPTHVSIEPKEAVKLFGRLAEKYIMLDSSGGMCCYSACAGKFLLDLVNLLFFGIILILRFSYSLSCLLLF